MDIVAEKKYFEESEITNTILQIRKVNRSHPEINSGSQNFVFILENNEGMLKQVQHDTFTED